MKPVYAQVNIEDKWPFAEKFDSLGGMLSQLLPTVMIIAAVIFFILIIGAGIAMIAGAGKGDPHNQEKAKNFLTYSVIGLALIFGAFWIMQIFNFLTQSSLGGIF